MWHQRGPKSCRAGPPRLERDTAAGTVRSVTWTADPTVGISSDQFALFRVSVKLPRRRQRRVPGHADVFRRHGGALGPGAAARRRRARTPGTGVELDRCAPTGMDDHEMTAQAAAERRQHGALARRWCHHAGRGGRWPRR